MWDRYFFTVYALDTMLNVTAENTEQDVIKAMQGHILEKATLIGLYSSKN